MDRRITIKGVGSVSAKPDFVEITMSMVTKHMEYDRAMNLASKKINELNKALTSNGFSKEDIKTINFDVRTSYLNEKDFRGNYHKTFDGYVVSHELKISFDFDMSRLAQALSALASCKACPEFQIDFTLKNQELLKNEILRAAAVNAKRKAELLCEALGVKLGALLSIDYDWSELEIECNTNFHVPPISCGEPTIDIHPDNIHAEDSVSFAWEIAEK